MLSDQLLDLSTVLKQSTPTTPILMLYNGEQELVDRLIKEAAQRKQIEIIRYILSGHVSEEKTVRAVVQHAIAQVHMRHLKKVNCCILH